MAARLMLALLSLCTLPVYITHVAGVVTAPRDYNLHVLSVRRQMSDDYLEMAVDVEFTASYEPEVEWTYGGEHGEIVVMPGTTVDFANGHGTASARFGLKLSISLKIGYFDTHYFDVFIRWNGLNNNIVQTLNTQMSTISSGYDIAYSPGESFNVTVTIPKHVAEGFTWSRYLDQEDKDYNVRLKACYVDPDTNNIMSSVDYFYWATRTSFMNAERTYGVDSAIFEMAFRTSEKRINGYFTAFTISSFQNDTAPKFVTDVWETVLISVHDNTTPGPFPVGYAYVRTSYYNGRKSCASGQTCWIYCYGYSNDIESARIFKEAPNGTRSELSKVYVRYRSPKQVVFNTNLETSPDFTGAYVCQITSRDGTSGERTTVVYEKY